MTKARQKPVALLLVIPSAILVVGTTAFLVRDYREAHRRAPLDKAQLERLQEMAREDTTHTPSLNEEVSRQTKVSLTRQATQRTAALVLIAAVAVFLACAKWLVALARRGGPDIAKIRLLHESPTSGAKRPIRAAQPEKRSISVIPTAIDLAFVEEVVAKEGRSPEAAIPILQSIQSHYRYLPDEALKRVCELTDITPSQIAGVSSFYAQFRRSPVGEHIVKVCHGTACHVAGARQITDEIRRYLEIAPDADTDPARMFTIDEVACLGCCSLAPVIMIDDETAGKLTPASACQVIKSVRQEATA